MFGIVGFGGDMGVFYFVVVFGFEVDGIICGCLVCCFV